MSELYKKTRINLLKMMPKYSICAEIGVWRGNFSDKILEIIKPKKLHLIDCWIYSPLAINRKAFHGGRSGSQEVLDKVYLQVLKKFDIQIKQGVIEIHRSLSEEAYKLFQDNYFDWIYIDGNHQYEYVKKDLELYYSKIKCGGYITGDDYMIKKDYEGPIRAVDEFVASGKVRLIKISHVQFILQKV